MPLSEHEQRILAELEESLIRHDPEFAERVRSDSLQRHASRRCKWAAAGIVVGAVIAVGLYSRSVLVGFLGVVLMFVCALTLEQNLRRTGRGSWRRAPRLPSLRTGGEGRQSGVESGRNARSWLRARFRRDH